MPVRAKGYLEAEPLSVPLVSLRVVTLTKTGTNFLRAATANAMVGSIGTIKNAAIK